MPGTGRRLQQLCSLVRDTFDEGELKQLVMFELDLDLDAIVPPGKLDMRVFDLLVYAERHGQLVPLAEALSRNREYRTDLRRFVEALVRDPDGGAVLCETCPHRTPPTGATAANATPPPADAVKSFGVGAAPTGEGEQPAVEEPRPPKPPKPGPDPDDPQKGRWGGQPERDGRRLGAELRGVYGGTFEFDLSVTSTDGSVLVGPVVFHVHDSYPRTAYHIRKVRDGARAVFEQVEAWGCYTVGAQVQKAGGGWTRLEYDLCDLPGLPKTFRAR